MRQLARISRGPVQRLARLRPDREGVLTMSDLRVLHVPLAQREVLRQALADAVHYRDPPVQCDACEAVDGLCDQCAGGFAQARAYLDLGRELGVEVSA
jgi:hypothetical protein